MNAQYYEISIVVMDDQCNNSVDYVDVCTCSTKAAALKATKKAISDLKAGKYNSYLKNVKYVYINALPYDEDYGCIIGLAWDYASNFFKQINEKWYAAL